MAHRCCNLGRLELQAIGSALASPPPHLRALNLWGNKICDEGVKYLAEALEVNFGLQFLGLGRALEPARLFLIPPMALCIRNIYKAITHHKTRLKKKKKKKNQHKTLFGDSS